MYSFNIKGKYFKLFVILLALIFKAGVVYSKVEPPNYNFSLDELATFAPGKSLKNLNKKYGKALLVENKGEIRSYRFLVSHIRYKFPVIVQTKGDKILDFYATLPSYFLHDVFHQSLINRIGKQDQYLLSEEHAIYVWKNKNNFRHVYSAACSITCFPIFYSVSPKKEDWQNGYRPLVEELVKIEKDLKKPVLIPTKN